MIQDKLIVGRFLHFNPGASRPLPGIHHVPAFVDVVCPPLQINESTRQSLTNSSRHSNIVAGTNLAKAHRNFKWLPWYAGDISMTTLDRDVLTGPMSGCLLVSFRQGAVTKVGHLGTVTVTDAIPGTVNTAVKTLWNNFANAQPGDVRGGFNPVANTVPPHPPPQPGDKAGQTWGLFTTAGQFYAVNVWVQNAVGGVQAFRIAGVHLVPTMGLAALQAV